MLDRLRTFIVNRFGFKTKEIDPSVLNYDKLYILTENNYLANLKRAVESTFPPYVEVKYAKRKNPELAPMSVRIVVETP